MTRQTLWVKRIQLQGILTQMALKGLSVLQAVTRSSVHGYPGPSHSICFRGRNPTDKRKDKPKLQKILDKTREVLQKESRAGALV